jgi:TetR/AcrR family transcriptional regulator of autoinduction and epiphytic fitness
VEQQAARADLTPLQRLQVVTRWLLELQLAGEMPTLPSQNSSLRAELLASRPYMDALMQASERLGEWIVQAQAEGQINPGLPPEVVLYTVFARACDPVPAFPEGRRPAQRRSRSSIGSCPPASTGLNAP